MLRGNQDNKAFFNICPSGSSPLGGEPLVKFKKESKGQASLYKSGKTFSTREDIPKHIYSKLYRLNLRAKGIMREYLCNPDFKISVSVWMEGQTVLSWAMLIQDYDFGIPGLHVYTRASARGNGYGSEVAKSVIRESMPLDKDILIVHGGHSFIGDEGRRRNALWESLEKHFGSKLNFEYLD